MIDLLRSMELDGEQQAMVAAALRERVRLYAQGCIKYGKDEEAVRVRELAAEVLHGL